MRYFFVFNFDLWWNLNSLCKNGAQVQKKLSNPKDRQLAPTTKANKYVHM